MTAGPPAGPASAYPTLNTPALICFSAPNEVFVSGFVIDSFAHPWCRARRLPLCASDDAGGFQDVFAYDLRLGDHDHVRVLDLDDICARTPGVRTDDIGARGLVAGGNDRPGRQLPPGGRSGRVAERRSGDGALGGGHQRGSFRGQVSGESLPDSRRVDRELDRSLPLVSGRVGVLDQGRVQNAVLRPVFDTSQVFALIRGEGGHVDQANDVRGAGRSVGDHGAAVRVTDQRTGPSIWLRR